MFIVPAVCCGIAAVTGLWRRCARPGFWRRILLTVCLQYLLLVGLYFLLRRFAAGSDGSLPPAAVCAFCLPPYIALILSLFDKGERWQTLFRRLGAAAGTLILAECFLFNGVSLTASPLSGDCLPGELYYSGPSEVQGDALVLSGDGTLRLEEIPAGAGCLQLFLRQQEGGEPITLTLGMRDGNFTESFPTVAQKRWQGEGCCRLSFRPYGEDVSLQLRLENVTGPLFLEKVTLSDCPPFTFSPARFWALLIPAGLLLAVIGFSLYRVRYRRNKPSHLICVGLTVALCMGLCGLYLKPDGPSYPYTGAVNGGDPYALTFDAFQKGQVWLDLPAEEGLAELDNPYSYDQRQSSGVAYRWDTAYYNGKYYSYFGVTPVLTFYYPYYWITGELPDPSAAVNVYALGSILTVSLALLTALRFFTRRPNLLLLLLSLAAVSLCCGTLYTVNDQSPKYQLPLMAGLFWLAGCLFAGMRGYLAKKTSRRLIWLFVSGACMALCLGARPTAAVNAALLIPLFLGILISRRRRPAVRIAHALCFLLPLAAGAAGLCWYNAARFGSPFDFGAAWQLTVSDVHANGFRMTNLFAAVFHYFLTPPAVSRVFPFFAPNYAYLANYGQYVYMEGVVGWLFYPAILLGLLWLIPAIRDVRIRRMGASPLQRRAMLILCVAVPVLLATADLSMGGVNQRYLYDIVPLLLIGSTAALLSRCRRPERDRYIYTLACLALIATVLFALLIPFTDPSGNLAKAHPELYNRLEEAVVFWR